MSRLIDDSDPCILSNITNVHIHKKVKVQIGKKTTYVVNFANPIWNPASSPEDAVSSDGFKILGNDSLLYIDDDSNGAIRLYSKEISGVRKYIKTIGTVEYDKGIVTLNDLQITLAANNMLKIHCIPDSNDIVSVRNQLVVIEDADIVTNAIADTVASGKSSGGTNYQFTSKFVKH